MQCSTATETSYCPKVARRYTISGRPLRCSISSKLLDHSLLLSLVTELGVCDVLHCFDTVCLASVSRSNVVVICLEQGADCLHMVQLMPLPSRKPHHLLPHLNPDQYRLFKYLHCYSTVFAFSRQLDWLTDRLAVVAVIVVSVAVTEPAAAVSVCWRGGGNGV